MMKITGLSHLFKWENLHNWWLTKYFFAPLYVDCEYCTTGNFCISIRWEQYGNQTVTYAHATTGLGLKSAYPNLKKPVQSAVPTPSWFLTAVTIRFAVMLQSFHRAA